MTLSAKQLREILSYDEESGRLTWIERNARWFSEGRISSETRCKMWNKRFSGHEALITVTPSGYMHGRIDGVKHYAHRVAWCIHYGEWPEARIDHINENKCDNRISNMRIATNSENMMNRGKNSNNSSGLKGVYFHKMTGRWAAKIGVDGRNIHIGIFDNPNEAHKAYCEAADKLHGEFSNHG